jgi:hypothetical protein
MGEMIDRRLRFLNLRYYLFSLVLKARQAFEKKHLSQE